MEKDKNKVYFYNAGEIEIVFGEGQHSFPWHTHESFCIGIILEGKALMRIGEEEAVIEEGTCFINPSHVGIKIEPKGKYKYITVCFKEDCKDKFNNMALKSYFIKIQQPERFKDLCQKFIQSKQDKLFADDIKQLIEEVIIIKDRKSNEEAKQSSEQIVMKACSYIKEHLEEKFSLDELAKATAISKYYLIRIFKKEMGVSPNQYYIQEKMRIIKEEAMSIENTAYMAATLSFSDESHLCNTFKKWMGISLKEYKKNVIRLKGLT